MVNDDILDALYAKRVSPEEFSFDALQAPSIYNFLSDYDMEKIYNITTSVKYSSKVDKKIQAIKDILSPRGFVVLSNGTNRMCYRYVEDRSFVLKVPYKMSGLDNGAREYQNQQFLKPFVTKTFQVHPTGISLHERVTPITSREEYLTVADDVFDMLVRLTGKYVLEDVGSKYFMNIGIRKGFGVVVLDYPELFLLDGNKLVCNKPLMPNTTFPICGGLIDFDRGLNTLVCTKCGKEYPASELQKLKEEKKIISEGDTNMKIRVMRGNHVELQTEDITDRIIYNERRVREKRSSVLKVRVIDLRQVREQEEEEEVEEEVYDTTVGSYVNRNTDYSKFKFEDDEEKQQEETVEETVVEEKAVEPEPAPQIKVRVNLRNGGVETTQVESKTPEPEVVSTQSVVVPEEKVVERSSSADLVKIRPNNRTQEQPPQKPQEEVPYDPQATLLNLKQELDLDDETVTVAINFLAMRGLKVEMLNKSQLRKVLLEAKSIIDSSLEAEKKAAASNVLSDKKPQEETSTEPIVEAEDKDLTPPKQMSKTQTILKRNILDSSFIPTGGNLANY